MVCKGTSWNIFLQVDDDDLGLPLPLNPEITHFVQAFNSPTRVPPIPRQVLRDCLDWRCAFGVVLWYGQCEEADVAEEVPAFWNGRKWWF